MALVQPFKINHGFLESGMSTYPDATFEAELEYDNGVWALKNIKLKVAEQSPNYEPNYYSMHAADVSFTYD